MLSTDTDGIIHSSALDAGVRVTPDRLLHPPIPDAEARARTPVHQFQSISLEENSPTPRSPSAVDSTSQISPSPRDMGQTRIILMEDVDGTCLAGCYEGELLDGKPHGKGTYRAANGDVWEGDFFGGQLHGRGRCRKAGGRVAIEGDFFVGELHGTATGRKVDGKVALIEGRFFAGRMQGRGTCTLKSGAPIEVPCEELDHFFRVY